MVGSRDHRTQVWKGAIQGPFHQSLVAIGIVVSDEKIGMWKFTTYDGRTMDAKWWQKLTWPLARWDKKDALDSQSQVMQFTSCLPMVGGSLRVLRLPPPLKLVTMI